MGRINLSQLKYFVRQITRIIPYKFRKPFYLFGGILGLIAWFYFLLNITHSEYLYVVKDLTQSFTGYIWSTYDHRIVIAFVGLVVAYICFRYFRRPQWTSNDEETTDDTKIKDKKQYNGSIYYQVNGLISILYVAFLILAFLPLVL